jgi:benzoate membrane transport protein
VPQVLTRLREDASGQALATGVSAALLGYASSVAVVVAGLTAVGASSVQVGSALLALGVGLCLASVLLSGATRVPVSVVWSTPALAVLTTTGPVEGGLPAVLGGFLLAAVLVVLTGLVPAVPRLLERLPRALSSAVLAGVLLPFCLAPATALEDAPVAAGVVCVVWLAALRLAPRYQAPAALAALVVVVAASGQIELAGGSSLVPALELTVPRLTVEAVVAVALPFYVVTMAAQNLVGLSVLSAQGYRAPTGRVLVGTGVTSALLAPFGAPTACLAAMTGALTAGPAAHDDRSRRWVAPVASGGTYLVLGAVAPLAAVVITQADPALVAAAAGLGLLGALVGALTSSVADEAERVPAVVTLLVTASGVTLLGLASAPLGLAAGLLVRAVLRPADRTDPPPARRGRSVA